MADRPNVLPEWASSELTEDVDGDVFPNRAEPPEPLKQSGMLYEQGFAREHMNYLFFKLYEWINFFDSTVSQIGMPILIDPVRFPAYVAPTGWTQEGTITAAGGVTYDVYVRTS